jgi:4-amino-4-deoxy-L-arabinose transferase-like glycosyltransferase
LGGALTLLVALEKQSTKAYFRSGALFGLAFIMKQPGVFFFLFGALYILYDFFSSRPAHSRKRLVVNLGVFSAGAAAPLLIILAWVYTAGVFDKFWFWTVEYASSTLPGPSFRCLRCFKSSFHPSPGFILFGPVGFGLPRRFSGMD